MKTQALQPALRFMYNKIVSLPSVHFTKRLSEHHNEPALSLYLSLFIVTIGKHSSLNTLDLEHSHDLSRSNFRLSSAHDLITHLHRCVTGE